MVDALRKANKVADKLKTLDSEVEFWNWYDKEIKQESQLVDDRLTFAEAIAKVEDDFWNRRIDLVEQKGSETKAILVICLAGMIHTGFTTKVCLLVSKLVNHKDILAAIDEKNKGARGYKYAVSAMKKLARVLSTGQKLKRLKKISLRFVQVQKFF
jgi:transcriptional regulatory protein LevR